MPPARPSRCPRCGCRASSTRPASAQVDALKIDVEGYEDRALIGFFKQAPQALWPRAVVIEHLSQERMAGGLHRRHVARGYVESGKTRSNTMLVNSEQGLTNKRVND